MKPVILIAAAALLAMPAQGQLPTEQEPPSQLAVSQCGATKPQLAKRAFVENFGDATFALQTKDWMGELGAAGLARPHTMSGDQEAALPQIAVSACGDAGNSTALAEKLRNGILNPCIAPAVRQFSREVLDDMDSGAPGSEQQ